jgi:hypothetical protein
VTSELIERAAKAAYEAYYERAAGLPLAGWDGESEHAKDIARAQVRAVLAAIREPTEAVLRAGATWGTLELDGKLGRDFTPLWQAMVDAALKARMSATCSERFFIHGADTPDNRCQHPLGHSGPHQTAMSTPSGGYACSIRWGKAAPIVPWDVFSVTAEEPA